MQGNFAARCQAWTRFILLLALSVLVVPSAFAQGAAGAAASGAHAASDPAPSEQTTPPVDDLPNEPPRGATLPAGEAERARGLPLQKIEVLGNRRVTPADVLTYVRERVGQPFKPETLTQDVRELWNSGFFDDIEVDLDRHDEGVDLRFVVRERPSISEITFEGNDEISKDDLNEGIEIKAATILSLPAVRRTVQKIRNMYAEKGYFLAEVQYEIVPQKNNEVSIKFKITEHGQVSVRRITFIGNQNVSSSELRSLMLTGNAGFFAFGSGGPFRQDAFERDIAVLSAMYYDRGFLSVSISTPRIMLRSEPGQFFNRAELLEDLQAIRTLYRDHGYANVEANPQTQLDPETHEVDVSVPVERGPLVYFERIEIRGNSKTRDKVIRREFEVAEGELFSETKLERSKRRATALGYFERVDVSTEAGSAPDKMNVYVEVAEKPTGTFQVGAGFSSIENFIATAQVQQANLFGNGQSLSLQAQVSSLRQLVSIRFFEPYFLDSLFNTSIDLYDQLRVYNDFSQSSLGGALTFGYPLIEPEVNASVTYTASLDRVSTATRSTLLGTSSATSVFTQLPLANLFNDGLTSSIRPALTLDTRDNRLFPTKGIYLYGSSELAAAALGSENRFLKHRFIGRFYYPIGAGFVLKLNMEAGHVTSPSSDGVPIFARFFLGGILDVRGYRFRTIGPCVGLTHSTDPNSAPIYQGAMIGGNLQYFQNLELEFPIVESVGVRGVLFTDAGNAWNLENNYCKAGGAAIQYDAISPCFNGLSSLTTLRTSVGFGIRWFSPLGPLRFEWGFPLKPLPYEEHSVFEFTIGNFF